MRQLVYVILTLLIVTLVGCRQNKMERQYERFQEDTTMEFITPPADTVEIEETAGEEDWMDEGELITIPDIPQERHVDMGASDYELEKMMKGRGE
jgi:hypothetical protein